jgi:VanZ family protein
MNSEKEINRGTAATLWLVTIGYMGIIFYLSSRQHFGFPPLPTHFDKIIHMCIYMPLAFLMFHAMDKSGLRKNIFLIAFIAASIYGITDEIHQLAVPGRDASVGDVLADSVGAFLGSMGASFTRA